MRALNPAGERRHDGRAPCSDSQNGVRPRGGRAARVPARGERAEARQRLAGPFVRRHPLRGLSRERRRDWRPAVGRGHTPARRDRPHGGRGDRRWAPSNTNLGIVLLLAPLVRARRVLDAESDNATSLRDALRRVLDTTTVDDAREVYAAIRRAAPGGLGRADAQDVADEPTVTLLEVMRLAADRDCDRPRVRDRRSRSRSRPPRPRSRARAATASRGTMRSSRRFFMLLAAAPGHAHRAARRRAARRGGDAARRSRRWPPAACEQSEGRAAIDAFDRTLRSGTPANLANPGTTADLTAAAIFVVLAGGGWTLADIFQNGGCDAATR